MESIKSFQYQLYPSDKYDIIVVSNEKHKDTNILLEQLPVKTIITDKTNYNKARALQYAIAHTPDKIYDTAIIMDADNNVDNTFLKEINDALYSGGMAIQTHRVSRKLHTDTALFAAISEEINNSIFRLGHVNIGFSSALIGSGMALNFSWLKKNLASITMNDVVKELEIMLLEQSIYIEYLNNTHVYGEKAPKADQYYQQRTSWYFNPVKQFISSFIKIPKAIIQGNYDLFDKLFQWLIPS
ncbi:MAG: glycosyltransferase, partial [Rikenellaceae bacterium]